MDLEQLTKRGIKIIADWLVTKLLAVIMPYVLILCSLFIACIVAYFAIFEMPKQSILGAYSDQDQIQALYFGSKEEQDDAITEYQRVADGWKKGLNQNQLNQVDPYALPWGWLAIVDRTLNDPSFVSTYSEREKEVILKPEQTFKEVRPTFKWDTREKKTVKEYCVRKKESWVIVTKTTVEQRELLLRANTMQNSYVYSYEPSIVVTKTSSPCGTLTTTVYWFSITEIKTVMDEDWVPLRQLLIDRRVSDKDQEFLMDYWLSYLVDDETDGGFLPPDDWLPSGGDLLWPTPSSSRITSSFGIRVHPVTGETKMHNGIDIGAPERAPVLAVKAGIVVYAAPMGTAGNAIIIRHADMETRYYHLSRIDVANGQEVEAGQKIGEVGSTGRSTGPHLHFEVRVGGNPVDPLSCFGYTGVKVLTYKPLNIAAMQKWLKSRNSALAEESILRMIDQAGRATNVDPYLLIAITGAEQSFVPASHPQASQIIRNPWNVFGSWNSGKGATLNTGESAQIAARTIVKLSKKRPANANPIQWLSSRDNPSGYYAADSENWWKNVSSFYDQFSKLR
ncbi:M23 family metallopeptidase [Paenibacillus polymyxa]|uniref:M23 family metallopeptidase n=1 Tax=Paenibacillus polymyxa TaxID=1406 RepID=UPI002AB3D8B9|nr:M23 family metallopeptidase [Paenibacillus polymyxa]MDY7989815.1 M23 family metallopeptidase [Paenibacillus polymyxa]MDY8116826.1 M23 family metallopeptidase [Paenibacillus polymyxa]